MRIDKIDAFLATLPLKHEFSHASASRRDSTNVFVRCQLEDGTVGWGEGVPRHYVTGETADTALQRFRSTDWSSQLAGACRNWEQVIQQCDQLKIDGEDTNQRGCANHSLRCAIELSLLDAYGQSFGQPLSSICPVVLAGSPIVHSRPRVRYSGAVGVSSPWKERWSATKMRLYGFADCKLKVGGQAREAERIRSLRRWLGGRMTLRLDANEAWTPEQTIDAMAGFSQQQIASLEQPVAHQDVMALRHVRQQIDVPVMLDESLTSELDATHAIENELCDLFNLRLSKCGGFIRSLRLAAMAHQAGVGYQLGCHPGESGILSAAGRHWACSIAAIRFLEGSYDRHLMQQLFTDEDITFGYGGWAEAIKRPGLGIRVNERLLRQHALPMDAEVSAPRDRSTQPNFSENIQKDESVE